MFQKKISHNLKHVACDKLLEARVESKLSAGRVKDDVMARLTVAIPKPRDNRSREVSIPESVRALRVGDVHSKSHRETINDCKWCCRCLCL